MKTLIPDILIMIVVLASPVFAFTSCTPILGDRLRLVDPRCRTGHYQITLDGLDGLHLSPDVVHAIAIANILVDINENKFTRISGSCGLAEWTVRKPCLSGECYTSAEHFDRAGSNTAEANATAFADGLKELAHQRRLFIARLHSANASSCSDLNLAINALGHALHALQDAYSHSSYIEYDSMIQGLYNAALRKPDLLMPLPSKITLTGYDAFGATPETPAGDTYSHCAHSKDYPNKNADTDTFFGGTGYKQAYDAAVAETNLFMTDLIAELSASDIDKLAFVSDCPALIDFKGQSITSNDPNDKTGSLGVGSQHFLTGLEPLRYYVYFENTPTASASAQDVVITDVLDKNLVDLNTLVLGPMAFTNKLVTPPSTPLALSTFSVDVDLRPVQNLLARVSASLNTNSGALTWHFQSIDPATGKPTTDPVAGFLPIGGEGSVTFTVQSAANLSTNTGVSNKATVIFDSKPLDTPVWSNTLDNTPPVSKISSLSSPQNATSFLVNWSGTDVGSGIQDYTVWVSDNNGVFSQWLTNTTLTTAMYHGIAGHTYSFYVNGRDLTGNVEAAKAVAEASTTVAATPTCVANFSDQIAVTQGGFRYNNATKQFVQTVTLTSTSLTAITGPISLVLDGLSTNATLTNGGGSTACSAPSGSTYLNATLDSSSSLASGQSSTVTLSFTNPTNAGITYTPRVLAGPQGR